MPQDDEEFSAFALQTNKKHGAGVTFIQELSENLILTGSYDKFLKIWDRRKINQEVGEFDTGR